jgi:hypothetical protein
MLMTTVKHPAEVFGHPIDVHSEQAESDRARYWCPFMNAPCDKQSRLIDYPMGVCSVQYNDDVVALSPRRFLQDSTVFYDIADQHFGSRHDLLLFEELSVPSARHLGRFDYVMVKHKPLSREIVDFVGIEFQTGQTTDTGNLVRALENFIAGEDIVGQSYRFGLNLADIWKRTFIQILTKGIAFEQWGHKIYWVIQEPIYEDFLARYHLHGMQYEEEHSTVFAIYDLERRGAAYTLFRNRLESATIDGLFNAFRTSLEVPPKEVFVEKLRSLTETQASANLRLDVEG